MEVRMTLPSAVEGEWKLEEPNTIVIKPHFYKKSGVQTLLGVACLGESGKRRDTFLTIDPISASVSVRKIDEVMVPIRPRFDLLTVAATPTPKKKVET